MEHHVSTLIMDLALILGVGAVVTLIFRIIKQPTVLGYILAGFLISPHLNLIPVADEANIKTLAEIGVIFLLFGLGLEFSFKKLMRVGGSASVTALVEIIFIVTAGYLLGMALGWSNMDCLFLGGMLASSSTTIIIRAFDELGLKAKSFAKVVFGVLVVEDIVVILLMVLLSTVAVTTRIEGSEMLFTVGKMFFFLAVWFIFGIYLIPTFLKKIKGIMDDEGYLILSIGLCLAMVIFAVTVGFSAELGAFIMGSILAETVEAEKIEDVTKSVKDLFGTIFFVSVGMMIDPKIMVEYGWIVILVTILVIVGKTLSTTAGAILSGQTLKQSIHVGMSMAQIGEFAFIVATLGMSLGVISDFMFPVAVGASALTTFTTPYMIKYSDNFYNFIERILPNKWIIAIDNYSTNTKTIGAESKWKKFIKSYIKTLVFNGIVVLALLLIGTRLLYPFLTNLTENNLIAGLITLALILVISSPFIWAVMFKMPNNATFKDLWSNATYNNGPILILSILKIIVALMLIGYFIHDLFFSHISSYIFVPIILLLVVFASRRTKRLHETFEKNFISNLNSREINEAKKSKNIIKQKLLSQAKESLLDIHITDLEIKQDAEYAGKNIEDLPWREDYGINIGYIKRGDIIIHAPGPKEKILPFDHIGVIAADEEIEKFMPLFNKKVDIQKNQSDVNDITIEKIRIADGSPLHGKEIKNSNIRERSGGLIIGIEREGKHFMNPGANTTLEANDIIWVVGEGSKLKNLRTLLSD